MARSAAPRPAYKRFTGGLLPAQDGTEDSERTSRTRPLDPVIRRHHERATGARVPRRTLTLLAIVVAAVVAGGTAGTAEAAQPCWKKLVNDWYDGRIDGTYPVKCYQAALDNLPEDVRT